MIGAETSANMLPILESIYQRKKEIHKKRLNVNSTIFNQQSKVTLYDLHDGKMLYLMTQHSLYNRKHPLLTL